MKFWEGKVRTSSTIQAGSRSPEGVAGQANPIEGDCRGIAQK